MVEKYSHQTRQTCVRVYISCFDNIIFRARIVTHNLKKKYKRMYELF